jgi:putative MATE family efflux protein
MVIGLGFSIGLQIIIGRRNGEQNFKQIGALIKNSVWFIIPVAILLVFFVRFLSPSFLELVTTSKDILIASNKYLAIRSIGIPLAFINFIFIAFYTGITQTRVLIYATFIQAISNVIMDYLFIFGFGTVNPMGIEGAALASALSDLVALLFFIIFTHYTIDYNKYGISKKVNFQFKSLVKILKVSIPIMIQNFIALSAWLAFFILIEKMGERELGISHIIRSIYMVLMIPLFGFSSATNTMVSNLMGQKKIEEVLSVVRKIIWLCLAITACFLPFILLFPRTIISFYTNDITVIEDSLPLLYVIAIAMFFFCVAFIRFSAVTGTGKTTYSLAIETISISTYLFVAYLLGIVYDYSLTVVWCSEFIYFTMMALGSYLYFKFSDWRKIEL